MLSNADGDKPTRRQLDLSLTTPLERQFESQLLDVRILENGREFAINVNRLGYLKLPTIFKIITRLVKKVRRLDQVAILT